MLTKPAKAVATALALLASAGVTSAAYADDWHNVPHVIYVPNGTLITPEVVTAARGPLLDHCVLVAFHTIPARDRAILGHAFSTGGASGAGTGAATGAEVGILGAARFIQNATPISMLVGFLENLFLGGLGGNTLTNERFRSATDRCLQAAGGGEYSVDPVDADNILKTGVPMLAHVPGVADNWRIKREVLPGATNTDGQ